MKELGRLMSFYALKHVIYTYRTYQIKMETPTQPGPDTYCGGILVRNKLKLQIKSSAQPSALFLQNTFSHLPD